MLVKKLSYFCYLELCVLSFKLERFNGSLRFESCRVDVAAVCEVHGDIGGVLARL